MYYTWYESPVAPILLAGDARSLHFLLFRDGQHFAKRGIDPSWTQDDSPFQDCIAQLEEYFAGERTQFDLSLRMEGTDFQQRVWKQLTKIPYGETISYAELAKQIKQPGASRAVGSANGRNPISIIVPCHRVIASSQRLAGYGGGLSNKLQLLKLEGVSMTEAADPELAKVC